MESRTHIIIQTLMRQPITIPIPSPMHARPVSWRSNPCLSWKMNGHASKAKYSIARMRAVQISSSSAMRSMSNNSARPSSRVRRERPRRIKIRTKRSIATYHDRLRHTDILPIQWSVVTRISGSLPHPTVQNISPSSITTMPTVGTLLPCVSAGPAHGFQGQTAGHVSRGPAGTHRTQLTMKMAKVWTKIQIMRV